MEDPSPMEPEDYDEDDWTEWTPEELTEDARRVMNEIADLAERSVEAKDFDPGLPLEPKNIRAMAYLQRTDAAAYNRGMSKMKMAKPAPDLRLLNQRINAEVKVQDAAQKAAISFRRNLSCDGRYSQPAGLMKGMDKEYQINPLGGLSKTEFVPLLDRTTGATVYEPKLTPICDFVAWPTREILKDNGVSTERSIELEGLLPDFNKLPRITVAMSEFDKMNWVGPKWGMQAAIRPYRKKELKFCLQKMAQSGIPESTVYTFLGWKKVDNLWIYLHAGGAIGAEDVEVELPQKLANYKLPKKISDLRIAIKAVIALFEIGTGKIMYPLVSMAFLSVLMEPLRQAGIEPGVLMYLWGESGSRKSTIIALVLCLFGKFDNKSLPASFRDTAMNIEELAFIAKDTLLPVDDLYPTSDPKEFKDLTGKLEYLSRNQGDRTGRGRLARDGMGNYVPGGGHDPRGLIIASGEVQPLSGSSLARNYTMKIEKEDIDNEKLKTAQDQRDLLGQAMVSYLEWQALFIDDLPSILFDRFEELRETAHDAGKLQGRHGRLDEAVAHMYLGLEMFIKYAVVQQAISQGEADAHLVKAWDFLNQGADEQTETARTSDISQLFMGAILELQSQNKVYFTPMDGIPVLDREIVPSKREYIGWGPDDSGVYYFLLNPAIKAANELLRGQGGSKVIMKDMLLDALDQKDLLATPPGKARSYNKTIAGKTRWVSAVKGQAFDMGEKETPSD